MTLVAAAIVQARDDSWPGWRPVDARGTDRPSAAPVKPPDYAIEPEPASCRRRRVRTAASMTGPASRGYRGNAGARPAAPAMRVRAVVADTLPGVPLPAATVRSTCTTSSARAQAALAHGPIRQPCRQIMSGNQASVAGRCAQVRAGLRTRPCASGRALHCGARRGRRRLWRAGRGRGWHPPRQFTRAARWRGWAIVAIEPCEMRKNDAPISIRGTPAVVVFRRR